MTSYWELGEKRERVKENIQTLLYDNCCIKYLLSIIDGYSFYPKDLLYLYKCPVLCKVNTLEWFEVVCMWNGPLKLNIYKNSEAI